MAVGSPRATSLANDGPLSAPMRGEKAVLRRDDLRDHFSHAQKRVLFQALGCAHEEHFRVSDGAASAETKAGNAAMA